MSGSYKMFFSFLMSQTSFSIQHTKAQKVVAVTL